MSTEKYTVIRLSQAESDYSLYTMKGKSPFPSGGVDFSESTLHVETVEATAGEMREYRDRPDVIAAPVAFPTVLLAPDAAGAPPPQDTHVAWGIAEIGASASAYDGEGCTVAVLDTGIDASHPAFAGVRLDERDFTGTGNGDGHGHGTHCAGTIFGRDVKGMRIGVACGVREALIGKVFDAHGRGNSAMLYEALMWAMNRRANVLSMSLGFDFPGYVDWLVESRGMSLKQATSKALRDYTANLRAFDGMMQVIRAQTPSRGGMVVVAASGNESAHYTAHPSLEISSSLPASADGVVSVGAVGQADGVLTLADFSNIDCQLVAPGVDVVSSWPGGDVQSLQGTSMACPHVAGAALLWWQYLRRQGLPVNAPSVVARLLASARTDGLAGYRPQAHGNGLVRAP